MHETEEWAALREHAVARRGGASELREIRPVLNRESGHPNPGSCHPMPAKVI